MLIRDGLTRWIVLVSDGLIGLAMVLAGVFKGWHVQAFVDHLSRFQMWLPQPRVLAILIMVLEWVLGVALIVGFQRKWARRSLACLLAVFAVVVTLAGIFGWTSVCSCYGQLVQIPPHVTVLMDTVLILFLAASDHLSGTLEHPPRNAMRHGPGFGIGLVLVLALTWVGAHSSYVDPWVLRLRPGFVMPQMPAFGERAPNGNMNRLGVFTGDGIGQATLRDLARRFPQHEMVLIDTEGDLELSGWTVLPGRRDILSYYYRHLPTAFVVEDQVVKSVWYGHLP